MQTLVPCPSCKRHVQAAESACPFCSGELPADLASRAVPAATRRLSRVAAFSFATAMAAAGAASTTGCAADTQATDDGSDDSAEEDITKRKCCEPSTKPRGGIEGVWCCGDGTWQYDIGNGSQSTACKKHKREGLVCRASGCASHTTKATCEADSAHHCGWEVKSSGPPPSSSGGPVALYGLPPVEYECQDLGSPMPMYGMPPPHTDGGAFGPMYGAPPGH